jgi:hypothetical protein
VSAAAPTTVCCGRRLKSGCSRRDAEVQQAHVAFGNEDVVRLEIAMHDEPRMREGYRAQDHRNSASLSRKASRSARQYSSGGTPSTYSRREGRHGRRCRGRKPRDVRVLE